MMTTIDCKWVTLDSPFVTLKGKRVRVYRKPYQKQEYQGIGIITKVLFIFREQGKTYIDCSVVFELNEVATLSTVAEEDIIPKANIPFDN